MSQDRQGDALERFLRYFHGVASEQEVRLVRAFRDRILGELQATVRPGGLETLETLLAAFYALAHQKGREAQRGGRR